MKYAYRFSKMFSRLSVTIITLVLSITIINTVIFSQISSRVIRNDVNNANTVFLTKLNKLMDDRINDVTKNLASFVYNELDSTNISYRISDNYERHIIQKEIDEQLVSMYPYTDSIYIYFNEGKDVMAYSLKNSISTIVKSDEFFDKAAYEDFISTRYLDSSVLGVRNINSDYFFKKSDTLKDSNVLSFFLRITQSGYSGGDVMVVNIDEEYLLTQIDDSYIPQESMVYIYGLDSKFNLFYYNGNDINIEKMEENLRNAFESNKAKNHSEEAFSTNINGERYYITQIKSAINDRVYILGRQEKEMYKLVYSVNLTFFLLASFILIFGIIFSKTIDKKFYQPVLGILQSLKSKDIDMDDKTEAKSDEFKQINDYIEKIVSNNILQRKQLQSYFSYYKERVLHSLLNNDKNVIKMLQEDKIILKNDYKWFKVAVVAFRQKASNGSRDEHITSDNDFIQNIIANLSCYGDVDKIQLTRHSIALLLSMEENFEQGIIKKSIKENLDDYTDEHIFVNVGIGNAYDSIFKINTSFIEAEKVIHFLMDFNNSRTAELSEITRASQKKHDYPVHIENSIIRAIETDNYQALKDEIGLFSGYIKKSGVSIRKARKYFLILIYNMSGKLSIQNNTNEWTLFSHSIFDDFEELNLVQEMESFLLDLIAKNMKTAEDESGLDNSSLIDKIVKYINTHYMEDIGLNIIADYVYFSPAHLGKVFKDATGYTFTDYLTKVRMEAAANLLINKNMKISELINKVGYFSSQSFCRAFKNYYKCSTGEYRKAHTKKLLQD